MGLNVPLLTSELLYALNFFMGILSLQIGTAGHPKKWIKFFIRSVGGVRVPGVTCKTHVAGGRFVQVNILVSCLVPLCSSFYSFMYLSFIDSLVWPQQKIHPPILPLDLYDTQVTSPAKYSWCCWSRHTSMRYTFMQGSIISLECAILHTQLARALCLSTIALPASIFQNHVYV